MVGEGGREASAGRPVGRSLAKKQATRPTAIQAMKRAVVGRSAGRRRQSCPFARRSILSAPPLLAVRKVSLPDPQTVVRPSPSPPLFHCSFGGYNKIVWVRPTYLARLFFAKLSPHITHSVTHFSSSTGKLYLDSRIHFYCRNKKIKSETTKLNIQNCFSATAQLSPEFCRAVGDRDRDRSCHAGSPRR